MEDWKSDDGREHKGRVIAAIPCFNEERFIGSVVLKTKKYVDAVVVIDDGSTDGGPDVAAEAGAVVYRHECNKGYGAAIRAALQKGREYKADVLVTIDGDGQHDPKDIQRLVKPILDGEADVVIGSRFLGQIQKPPFYRRLGQRVLTTVTNVGSGQKLGDSQSGFRAYSSKALRELNVSENGMSVSSEIQFAIGKAGLRVAEVPISVYYAERAKRSPLGHGLNVLTRVMVLMSLRQPLVLFGVPGLGLLAGGLVFGVRFFTIYGQTGQIATGSALGALLLCISGILSLFAALMLQSMKELMRREWEQLQKAGTTLYENNENRRSQ